MHIRGSTHVIDVLKTSAIADATVLRVAEVIHAVRAATSGAIDVHDIQWARAELDKLIAVPDTSALKSHVGGEDQIAKDEFVAAFDRLERAFVTGRGLLPIIRRGEMRIPGGRTLETLPLVTAEPAEAIQAANYHGIDVVVATDGTSKIVGVNERGDLGARHVREVVIDDGTQTRLLPVDTVADVVNGFAERYVDLWSRIGKPFQEKWIDGTRELPAVDTSVVATATAVGLATVREEVARSGLRGLMRAPATALRKTAAAAGAIVSGSIGFALGTVPDMLVHALTDLLPALTGFAAIGLFTLPRAIRAGLGSRNLTPLLSHAGVHLSRPTTLGELS